jgi:hypothetical protein
MHHAANRAARHVPREPRAFYPDDRVRYGPTIAASCHVSGSMAAWPETAATLSVAKSSSPVQKWRPISWASVAAVRPATQCCPRG